MDELYDLWAIVMIEKPHQTPQRSRAKQMQSELAKR
jgi:hypothetical protein